jgi:hypothetical protein
MNTIVSRSPAMCAAPYPSGSRTGSSRVCPLPVRYVTMIVPVICGWIEQW